MDTDAGHRAVDVKGVFFFLWSPGATTLLANPLPACAGVVSDSGTSLTSLACQPPGS
jgi:hypothetical protein